MRNPRLGYTPGAWRQLAGLLRSRASILARAALACVAAAFLVALAAGTATAQVTGAAGSPSGQQDQQSQSQSQSQQTGQAQQGTASTAPAAPTGLSATAGDGQVALSWTAVQDATSYNVYAGTSDDFSASTRGITASTPAGTVTKLTDGTTYYFWVTAVDSAGESSASGSASATPAAAATVPGAPTEVKATVQSQGATVTWSAPASDGGAKISGYDVSVATSSDFRTGLAVAKVTGTSYTLSGVSGGVTYYFKVAAINTSGTGTASTVVSAVTGPAQPAGPGAPNSLSGRPGPGAIALSWTAPDPDGATISGYLVYAGTQSDGESATPISQTPVHGTSVVVTGLTGGTRYYLKVAAVGSSGRPGTLSAEVTAIPLASSTTTGAGSGPGTRTGPGTDPIQITDQGGSVPGDGTQTDSLTRHPVPAGPPAALIIALAGVATAATAGAIGVALHLRRRRRALPPPAAEPDLTPLDPVGGRR